MKYGHRGGNHPVEDLKMRKVYIFTVQFHPEACPGSQDFAYLFDRFIEMMGGNE